MTPEGIDLATTQKIGELLKAAREAKSLSRPDLGILTDLSRNRLQQIEQGYIIRAGETVKRPTQLKRDQLLSVCDALEMPPEIVDRILSLSGYKPLDRSREIVYLHGLSEAEQNRLRAQAEKYRASRKKK